MSYRAIFRGLFHPRLHFLFVPLSSSISSTPPGNPDRGGARSGACHRSARALCKMRRKAAGNESNVPDVSIISYKHGWPLSAVFSTPSPSIQLLDCLNRANKRRFNVTAVLFYEQMRVCLVREPFDAESSSGNGRNWFEEDYSTRSVDRKL